MTIARDQYRDDMWIGFKYLRSFPQGRKNCYSLRPKQGKNVNYLITAFFMYGNYDGKNHSPVFDLYIGVNRWTQVRPPPKGNIFKDVIHVPTTDSIDVCLLDTNSGTPFISSLQIRPLRDDSIYKTKPGYQLILLQRLDYGATPSGKFNRYINYL